jgi:hypothetical protein
MKTEKLWREKFWKYAEKGMDVFSNFVEHAILTLASFFENLCTLFILAAVAIIVSPFAILGFCLNKFSLQKRRRK